MTAMTIKHHISDALLMGYAAGTLPEAFSLLIATHVSLCDDCRAQLAAFEAVGGAIVEDQGAAMSDGALDEAMTRIMGPAPAPQKRAMRSGILPGPLADYVGGDLASVKWKNIAGGVRQAILPTAPGATVRLLYIPAGKAMPDHGHRGLELTMVLQGAFSDAGGRYGRGDVETATEDLDHTPIAEVGEDCICLAATDASLKFHGIFARLLQPLFRI